MDKPLIGILHYSAPPVIGGVEAVIEAHLKVMLRAGYPVQVITGRGEVNALPRGTILHTFPWIDSQNPDILRMSDALADGIVPDQFERLVTQIITEIGPAVRACDHLIVHNVFSKHFNIPLTVALHRLLEQDALHNCIAWCHDISWTSPNSRSKVHPGYPWDSLRTKLQNVTYVAVSNTRRDELAGLFACPPEEILTIYNGVDPAELLGLSPEGLALIERLGLFESDLNLIMPVRVTQAKNIEYALHVAAALKARHVRLKIVLTGPPDPHEAESMDYFESLCRLRRTLGVEEEMRFVFESGPNPTMPQYIGNQVVGDLFRVSDVMFMPSHREGFAMPVLEAGLAGLPVVTTPTPAAVEIAVSEALIIDPDQDADSTAIQLLELIENNPVCRLRRITRQNYTWEAIFRRQIEPLLRRAL